PHTVVAVERRGVDGGLQLRRHGPFLALFAGDSLAGGVGPGTEAIVALAQLATEAEHHAEIVAFERVSTGPLLGQAGLLPKTAVAFVHAVERLFQPRF